ncbi:APC family permease [Actinoallomurus sp. NPDC052308]|uniref:APC family permease n=1 Tax=Actinoallomurus sp. NPDC052308 TaxID=3155530 RepID=UPI003444FF82
MAADDRGDFTRRWEHEKTHLRKAFFRLDIAAFLICALVGLDTLGTVAAKGPQGLVWLLFLAVFFFLPYGLLAAELGSSFPFEGGPYVWTKLAFGRFAAGVNQVLYWLSNPVWLGGTLTIVAVTTWEKFFFALPGGWKYAGGAVFVWIGALAVLLAFRVGKWLPTIGAVARVVLIGAFLVSVVVYGAEHGVHLRGADLKPTYIGFVGLVPVLVFNYVGFELPSTAAEEMTDPHRDVPVAIARSGVLAVVLYGAPILGILLVLPHAAIGSLGGFVDACKAVFTVYGGHVAADGSVTLTGAGSVMGKIAALGLIIGVLTSGITWSMGGDRAQAVACADGAGPAFLGRFSARFGTPVRVNILSSVVSTVVMAAAFLLSKGDAQKYFSAVLGLAISTTFISYLLAFPSLYVLRRRLPDVERPYRAPAAGLVSALPTLFVVFTLVQLVWPGLGVGWFGTSGDPAGSLPEGFAHDRLGYVVSQLVPLALCVGLGVLFYVLGTPTRRARRSAVEPGPSPTGDAPAGR